MVASSVCGTSAIANVSSRLRDRQRDAVDRDRALLDAVPQDLPRRLDASRGPSPPPRASRPRRGRRHGPGRCGRRAARLPAAPARRSRRLPPSGGRASSAQCLRDRVEAHALALDGLGGEAHAGDRDRIPTPGPAAVCGASTRASAPPVSPSTPTTRPTSRTIPVNMARGYPPMGRGFSLAPI